MARRRRKNESLLEVLLVSPWWVSLVVAGAAYAGLRWMLPAMSGSNMFLKPMATAVSGFAGPVGGFFTLISLLVLVKQRMTAPNVVAAGPAVGSNYPAPPPVRPSGNGGVDADRIRTTTEDSVTPPSDFRPKPAAWSLDLIQTLEWKRFEDVCQQFYEVKGIRSETTPLGPDGGIDIRLYQDENSVATSIVQCKAWGERQVGIKPVRELLGVMSHEKIGKAFFMASGKFTDEARAFAQSNRITLIDGQMLLLMIQRLPAEAQLRLLEFATAGDYATPTCPSCGIKMRLIQGKGGRADFWGCRHYPKCRQTLGARSVGHRHP